MTRTSLTVRRVVIGGQPYDKTWDATCPACRSPWLAQIDEMLAEGYTFKAIRGYLTGRHPPPPREDTIRDHIAHLADPHRKMRIALEEAAAGEPGPTLLSVTDATAAVIAQGYAQLAHGGMEITARDLIRALALQAQIDRSQQGPGIEAAAWQAAFMSFFEIVRKHLSPAQWKAFVTDVYASPEIRAILAESQPAIGEASG